MQVDCNKYFYDFKQLFKELKRSLKGRFFRLLGLLLLFALPVAAVDAYTTSSVAGSVATVLPTVDFTSQSSVETLISSLSNGINTSPASFLLSFLLAFLQCAMYIFAAVFTCEIMSGRNEMLSDSSKFAKLILRKLPVVFLITYMASYLQGIFLQMCTLFSSSILLIPVSAVAIPLACAVLFVLISVITAAVDTYSSALIVSTSTGRVRFMFSLLYARLLYRGNFVKTVVYYSIICAATSIISVIPMISALLLSMADSPFAIVIWGISSLVQNLLAGLAMCFYTARVLQLENKNASLLRPFSFVNRGGDGDPGNDGSNPEN